MMLLKSLFLNSQCERQIDDFLTLYYEAHIFHLTRPDGSVSCCVCVFAESGVNLTAAYRMVSAALPDSCGGRTMRCGSISDSVCVTPL